MSLIEEMGERLLLQRCLCSRPFVRLSMRILRTSFILLALTGASAAAAAAVAWQRIVPGLVLAEVEHSLREAGIEAKQVQVTYSCLLYTSPSPRD